ncbi:beta-ketoadipate enol-lactone hydrolase [Novosphingobium sp. Rr 2-17]|uniref:3-oxoadipate enol-lactonase n=1 Tax=Novosphingobium sp. Rr 2-17 TaxID=555793 RepID=UPI000269A4E8|nr:3-oxoadipate enol-lactonase [Novosphingobium sp. Rr 2-17]EIZ79648.1 beta-ketoadipate enol-lactone hydrolase [Novosphingobium sp. Rr 2-17]
MPFVKSAGARLYWKREGEADKPPLVLINSIGTDMDVWDAVLPALRRRFLLLRIDTRGHGASDATPGDYAMALLAGDVGAAMDAAGIARAIVAGVSLGGMIAMQMALDEPERVAGLALICTSATMDRSAWTTRVDTVRAGGVGAIADLAMARFLSAAFVEARPDIAATIRDGLLAMAPEGYAGCAAAIRDMTLAERLEAIAAPTLVVTGKRDTSTPFDGHGEHLVRRIAGARHVALDAAHLAPLEAPEALGAAIIDMFA